MPSEIQGGDVNALVSMWREFSPIKGIETKRLGQLFKVEHPKAFVVWRFSLIDCEVRACFVSGAAWRWVASSSGMRLKRVKGTFFNLFNHYDYWLFTKKGADQANPVFIFHLLKFLLIPISFLQQ